MELNMSFSFKDLMLLNGSPKPTDRTLLSAFPELADPKTFSQLYK
jgi:hypothetical protein